MRTLVLSIMCIVWGLIGCSSPETYYRKAEIAYNMQNYKKAQKLFNKACNKGSADGCTSLAFMYNHQNGAEENAQRVIRLYIKACEMESARACNQLGAAYRNGNGVEQDYKQAKAYYNKACKLQYRLGCEWSRYLERRGF